MRRTTCGTGRFQREFLHVDDLADARLFLMDRYSGPEPVNVMVGEDVSIAEPTELIDEVVGYEGRILYYDSTSDGTPGELLDVNKLDALGRRASIPLEEDIEKTIGNYWTPTVCGQRGVTVSSTNLPPARKRSVTLPDPKKGGDLVRRDGF